MSPPVRGAWIETMRCQIMNNGDRSRPPHGGRGLKPTENKTELPKLDAWRVCKVQTFIPNFDLSKTAYILWEGGISGNRLNNQINEALIILRTLTGWYAERKRKGWPNHSCTKMWAGYEDYLADYTTILIQEYEKLSGNDCSKRIDQIVDAIGACEVGPKPRWLTEEFASNHRSILLGKAVKAYVDTKIQCTPDPNKYYGFIEDGNYRKFQKALKVLKWYQSFGWAEKPAEMQIINGKMRWPYLWPSKE